MIPVYVISLLGSEERRIRVTRQMSELGIPFQFFDGVDGRKLSDDERARAAPGNGRDYGGLLTPAEIGCALSHLTLIGQMAQSEARYFAVIEDDAVLSAALPALLDADMLAALPPFDILQLSSAGKEVGLALDLGTYAGFRIITSPKCRFNMSALIYSREAARVLSARITDISAPVDNMIFQDRRPFDFRVIEARPSLAVQDWQLTSDIGARPRTSRLTTKIERELRRLRNSVRLWLSFVHVWGIAQTLRLRPLGRKS